jgi:thymidylate synthase
MDYEASYDDLVTTIIENGQPRQTRNGATRALFGESLLIGELEFGEFPLLTRRRIHYKGIFGELAAFVRGARTVGEFKKWGCNYWDKNAQAWPRNKGLQLEDMEVGHIYGAQWVDWEETGYNQIENLIFKLRYEPHSRRHVLTTFSPTAEACLPPCHLLAQFYVNNNNTLDCLVYMRSVDVILGLPSDVVLYSALLIILAYETGCKPGVLQFTFGDTHIYDNHIGKFLMKQQHNAKHALPTYTLVLPGVLDFKPDNLEIRNYNYSEAVPYELNV